MHYPQAFRPPAVHLCCRQTEKACRKSKLAYYNLNGSSQKRRSEIKGLKLYSAVEDPVKEADQLAIGLVATFLQSFIMSKNNSMSDKTRATIAQAMQDSNIVKVIKAVQKNAVLKSSESSKKK